MDDNVPKIKGGGQVIKPDLEPAYQHDPALVSTHLNNEGPAAEYQIPSFATLKSLYDAKWLKEREVFYKQLGENFRALTEQFRSGKQEVFQLTTTIYVEKYIRAFRDLFSDTGYQASVGDIERSACGNKKFQKLFISLPECVR